MATPNYYNGINNIFTTTNHEGDLIVKRMNANAPKVLTNYEHLQNTTVFLGEIKALITKVIPQINSELDAVCSGINSKKERLRVSKKIKLGKKELLNQLYSVRRNIQSAVNYHQAEHDNEVKEQRAMANAVGANFIDMSHLPTDMSAEDMAKAVSDAINGMSI